MFKIVFRDISFYPKQLHLFCLLMLIIVSADSIGFITNFCSMNCCPSSKIAVVNIEAFRLEMARAITFAARPART